MAIIIETCPRCGAVLHDIMLASNPPIPKKECFSCGWSWMGEPEEVEYRPFGGNAVNTENSVLNLNTDYSNIEADFVDMVCNAVACNDPIDLDEIEEREMVERMFPGCEMCEGWNTIKLKPCANGDLGVQADIGSAGKDDTFGLVVYNHLLASGYVDFSFCPFCGKPKTDEAVDMMLERWKEALDND